jgi:hypothetical protein
MVNEMKLVQVALAVLLFGALASCVHTKAAQEKVRKKVAPKVLFHSGISIDQIIEDAEFWADTAGVSGFMLSGLAEWYSSEATLEKSAGELRRLNASVRKLGINSNLVLLRLGRAKLPEWDDSEAWSDVIDKIALIGRFAAESGCGGIAIDTEPLENPLWTDTTQAAGIKARSRELFSRIEEEAPGIMILIMPAAHYALESHPAYPAWEYFWKGLVSAQPSGQIVLAAEQTYSVTNPAGIEQIYAALEQWMIAHTPDRDFWYNRCVIALGAWPLGVDYKDKGARYPVEAFRKQLDTFRRLCPDYIWIYGHGSSWWQAERNSLPSDAWSPDAQVLPTTPDVDDYYRVLRGD